MIETFGKYIGVQGVIALALVVAVITLAFLGQPIPTVLGDLAIAAGAFYFGSKGGTIVSAVAEHIYLHSPRVEAMKADLKVLASAVHDLRPAAVSRCDRVWLGKVEAAKDRWL